MTYEAIDGMVFDTPKECAEYSKSLEKPKCMIDAYELLESLEDSLRVAREWRDKTEDDEVINARADSCVATFIEVILRVKRRIKKAEGLKE